jgi:hypothetical protein
VWNVFAPFFYDAVLILEFVIIYDIRKIMNREFARICNETGCHKAIAVVLIGLRKRRITSVKLLFVTTFQLQVGCLA